MHPNEITKAVIGAAIEVHRELGPGHDEKAYERALAHELALRLIYVQTQLPLPVEYKEIKLDCGYRLDLLVAHTVVVEVKSVVVLLPVHGAQLLTYLRLGKWNLGLLINFNEALLKDGVRRRVFGSDESGVSKKAVPRQQEKFQFNAETQRTQREGKEVALTAAIIGAAMEVHRVLGPGLLESCYRICLAHEVCLRRMSFERDRPLDLTFKGTELDGGAALDFVVEDRVVVKILAHDEILPLHQAQLRCQLHHSGLKVGLLINFNVPLLTQGLKRCICDTPGRIHPKPPQTKFSASSVPLR